MTPEGVNIKYPDKLFIGGKWVAPMSGSKIEIVNPNSEEVVAIVAEAGPDDMDAAVAAAREAFDNGPWPTTPPAERAAKLMAMADHLEARIGELSAAWTAQVGGLASFAPIMHGGAVAGWELAEVERGETLAPGLEGGAAGIDGLIKGDDGHPERLGRGTPAGREVGARGERQVAFDGAERTELTSPSFSASRFRWPSTRPR